MHMQEERGEPVDVQIGPQLYERAPQELRSRLWIALLDNGTLATSVENSAVCFVTVRMSRRCTLQVLYHIITCRRHTHADSQEQRLFDSDIVLTPCTRW